MIMIWINSFCYYTLETIHVLGSKLLRTFVEQLDYSVRLHAYFIVEMKKAAQIENTHEKSSLFSNSKIVSSKT